MGCLVLLFLNGVYLAGLIEFVLLVLIAVMAYEDLFSLRIKGYQLGLLTMCALMTLTLSPLTIAVDRLLTGMIVFIVLIVINRITRDGFGMGDVIVLASMTLIGGLYYLIMIFMIAILFVGLVSFLYLVLFKGNKTKTIPFVPFIFLAMGVMICQAAVK